MTNLLIETKKLRKEFGALVAVNDVSIQVQSNIIHSTYKANDPSYICAEFAADSSTRPK